MAREAVFDVRSLPKVGHSAEFTATVEESAVAELAGLIGLDGRWRCDEMSTAPASYGRCLVEGVLVVELVSSALRSLVVGGYLLRGEEMRFPSAVSIGEQVTVRAEVVGVQEDERAISVDTRIWRSDGETAFRGIGWVVQVEPSEQET